MYYLEKLNRQKEYMKDMDRKEVRGNVLVRQKCSKGIR